MRPLHVLFLVVVAMVSIGWFFTSNSSSALNGMRIESLAKSRHLVDMPYPRHGCRRCSPRGYDFPFVTRDGRELYLNANRSTQELAVIDCERNVVSRSSVEIGKAITRIKQSQDMVRDRLDTFCTGT